MIETVGERLRIVRFDAFPLRLREVLWEGPGTGVSGDAPPPARAAATLDHFLEVARVLRDRTDGVERARAEFTAALTAAERASLGRLLAKVVDSMASRASSPWSPVPPHGEPHREPR